MNRKRTIAAIGAAACIAGGGAAVAGATVVDTGSPTATAAAGPRISDIDADVATNGRLRLEAETAAAARRVSFTYNGKTVQGKLVDVDDDDRSRDWAVTVPARQADREGGRRVTVKVRACSDGDCATKTSKPFVEPREDDDRDDD
jgi:hypothetical protein